MSERSTRDALTFAAQRLAESGIDSARLDARVLLAHALGLPGDVPLAFKTIGQEQREAFDALIARRVAREPLAYITGTKEFFSLNFEVGPGVLVPRPDTETLIEEALREFPDRGASPDVLDLGTGSGCLLITFLKHYDGARGLGVDASPEALVWAARNVSRHGLAGRCTLVRGGWSATGAFDVVFANPPYLTDAEFLEAAPEISRHEPRLAFVAGPDGLSAYRNLIPQIAGTLKPGGTAFVEIGAGQSNAVTGIIKENGLELHRVAPDLTGTSRCIIAGRPS